MKQKIKHGLIGIASILAILYSIIPFSLRRILVSGLMLIESRIGQPDQGLKRLFRISDDMDQLINERSTAYGGGLNPKHRLTGYHDFFVGCIPQGSRVLDVGCGIGAVARSIATGVKGVTVVGIDSDPVMISQAHTMGNVDNLTFIQADVITECPTGPWDVVILSNVLEHIKDRTDFLRSLVDKSQLKNVLIRVPLFERHWHLPLRRELGVNYFSDPTHYIEHSLDDFRREMQEAGLAILEEQTLWGEIWAQCQPMTTQPN